MDYENPWLFEDNPFDLSDLDEYSGFVYLITNLTNNKKYIGKKFFVHTRRKAVKGKTRKKVVKFESDWKDYYGSSKALLEEVEKLGPENFRREILGLYKTKGRVNYHEVKFQFIYDVLVSVDENGERLFYNENILGRYYPKNVT